MTPGLVPTYSCIGKLTKKPRGNALIKLCVCMCTFCIGLHTVQYVACHAKEYWTLSQ